MTREQAAPDPVEPDQVSSRMIECSSGAVHVLEVGPRSGPDVLLLHGARFHSGTWRELGTLEFLAERGFHVVAMDVPGYGQSPKSAEFRLSHAIDALKLQRPVVLAASMSGRATFELLRAEPEKVGGLVAVAPVGIPEFLDEGGTLSVPTLALWGAKDRLIPLTLADRLVAATPQAKKVVLEGADHPCYLDRPEEFHLALAEFLQPFVSSPPDSK